MRKFFSALFTPYQEHVREARESWLAGAEDEADLKWRQEQVRRGMFRTGLGEA